MREYSKYNAWREGFTQKDYDKLNKAYKEKYGDDDGYMGSFWDENVGRVGL